jgi:hypothetical protein
MPKTNPTLPAAEALRLRRETSLPAMRAPRSNA